MIIKETQGNLTKMVLLLGTTIIPTSIPPTKMTLEPTYDLKPNSQEESLNATFSYDKIYNKVTFSCEKFTLEEPVMKLRLIGSLKVKIKKTEQLKYKSFEDADGFI